MITMGTSQHTATVAGVAWLVELAFTTGTLRLTTAPQDLPALGYSWQGLGNLAAVGDVSESADTGAEQIELSLSLVSTAMLASTLGSVESYRGRRVRLWLQLLDGTFKPAGDPVLRWAGAMEPVRVERTGADITGTDEPTGRIVLPCSRAGMARARHAEGRRLTAAQIKRQWPAETGLNYVRSLIETPQLWLSKRFQQQ
jgi:hypothetical protein